jgi:hypothetical protein
VNCDVSVRGFGGVWRFGCCLDVWFVNVMFCERVGGVWRFGCCLFGL